MLNDFSKHESVAETRLKPNSLAAEALILTITCIVFQCLSWITVIEVTIKANFEKKKKCILYKFISCSSNVKRKAKRGKQRARIRRNKASSYPLFFVQFSLKFLLVILNLCRTINFFRNLFNICLAQSSKVRKEVR